MWQFIYFSGGSKSRLVHSRLLRGQLRICQNTNYADQGAQNVLCPKLSTGIVQVAGVLVPWLVSLGESTNSTSCPKDSCAVGILVSTVLCPRNIFSWDSKTCKFELPLKLTLGFVVWRYFDLVLECEFAEIEDVSITLPNGPTRKPESRISSPDSPWLQSCYKVRVIGQTTLQQCLAGGVFTAG